MKEKGDQKLMIENTNLKEYLVLRENQEVEVKDERKDIFDNTILWKEEEEKKKKKKRKDYCINIIQNNKYLDLYFFLL